MFTTLPASVIAINPHPDDDIVGAGATLTTLRDYGTNVEVVLCSLGRPDQWNRRLREAKEAARRAGFNLTVMTPSLKLSANDDHKDAQLQLQAYLESRFRSERIDLVVGPQEADGHHAHETVGRAIRCAIEACSNPPAWWAWGIWRDLANPTIYIPFDDGRLERVERILEAHAGELDRNDYRTMIRGLGMANAIRGSERVFGYGSCSVNKLPYAELLEERIFADEWRLGEPTMLEL